MNYIGSISILDRGDAPAQAVIDRNARTLAQRVADETRDELNKVMSRVHTIYSAMDTVEDISLGPSVEYINDLSELEEILKDEIKKRQYQQQVTVFIVGYQDVCHQKLRLLQQVNEFFIENSKAIDEEDWFPSTPDLDHDEVSNSVEDSLNHAHQLTNRLAELNKEMVEYMATLAEKKASNKGRKKIERALQQARDEVSGLSEKLLTLQTELDDREEKVQNMFKQLESKNLEVQKFRTAAELAKKATEEMELLHKEISIRDAKIVAQRQQLSRLEVELTQSNHLKERTESKFSLTDGESQQKIFLLQKELDEQRRIHEETKADMTKLLDNQINALHESHKQEMEEMKKQHQTEADKLQEEILKLKKELAQSQHELVSLQLEQGANTETPSEVARIVDLDSTEPSQQVSRQSSKQSPRKRKNPSRKPESRPSTKDTKLSSKSLAASGKQSKGSKSPTRVKTESKSGSRASVTKSAVSDEPKKAVEVTETKQSIKAEKPKSEEKEFAEIAIQDEGGDPSAATVDEKIRTPATRQSKRAKSTLDPVMESDYDNAFDLFDEQSWAAVPGDQLNGKFAQYRRLSTHKIQELEEQLQLTTAKTKRKVATLKAQFQEHKSKWEAERKVLIEQVDQSLQLQGDAEKEADAAMTQLEDFITEQERLEQEEEVKRTEVLQASASLTPQDPLTPALGSSDHTPGPGTPHPAGVLMTPESEQELQRLMQQTDDAKVQEMNARLGMCVSAPPAVDMEQSSLRRSEQEVDSETAEDELKQEAEVDLSQLKELPLLDIADKTLAEDLKPSSGYILPSEATVGSSMRDNLETPLADLLQQDPIKLLKEQAKSEGQGELMDDGSNLEKGRTQVSEREATDAGSEAHHDDTNGGTSKQATEVSLGGGAQKSFLGQSLTSLERAKIDGKTEEEIRASSAHSRASLREQYKVKLEEAKTAAEDRRSKSPAINLPTQMTVDDELIFDDDDNEEGDGYTEDEKDTFLDDKDPSMYEVGTSPPPGFKNTSRDPTRLSRDHSKATKKNPTGPFKEPSDNDWNSNQPVVQKIIRKGTSLLEHPLLKEYLKAYDGVVGFKDGMAKIFLDKDMMSAHQMTCDLETLTFNDTQKAMPQVEELTKNIYYVLEELSSLINNILVYDREPAVSALNMISREQTQKSFVPTESITEAPVSPPATRDSAARENAESVASSSHSQPRSRVSSNASDKVHIRELQEHYNQLQHQLEHDRQNHEDQLQRNTVAMMEMQDTINDLQRELSALGKSSKRTKSALSSGRGTAIHHKSPSPETSVMFTRLDSERNAKIMKKAVMDDKLDPEKYKEAVSKMDEYVSLPAQRLAHLVKKYAHHRRMREIEEKVKNSSSVNEEVFDVLDKMENLQNQRARQWAERMDEMGLERLKLADLLMNTLDNIEQESGIFLIKPMYSYRGRDMKFGRAGKLSRPAKQHRNITPSNDAASSFVPAPTPASNYRLVRHERNFLPPQQSLPTMAEMRPAETRSALDDGGVKVTGNGMIFSAQSPRTTWNMQASQPWAGKEDAANSFNTPRILELDINRMLIGQNNISTKVPYPPTDDRLLNANQNTLRSYVTVNRPTASLGGDKAEKRPTSGRDSANAGSSSAHHSAKKVRVSEIDREIPASLPTPSPLPPITPIPGEEADEVRAPSVAFSDDDVDDGEPPQSPPGSSMYQSTIRQDDLDDTAKHTRASSRQSLSDDEEN